MCERERERGRWVVGGAIYIGSGDVPSTKARKKESYSRNRVNAISMCALL